MRMYTAWNRAKGSELQPSEGREGVKKRVKFLRNKKNVQKTSTFFKNLMLVYKILINFALPNLKGPRGQ